MPEEPFISTAHAEPGLNYLCAGSLDFFTHIAHPIRVMADPLRHRGYADEVKAIVAAEEAACHAI